jgi:hypothetical protein
MDKIADLKKKPKKMQNKKKIFSKNLLKNYEKVNKKYLF